jgi:penicillin-binding protein 1C
LPRGAEPSAALALGGGAISLFDLAALYADLASGGAVAMPHFAGATAAPSGALVSRRAAGQVAAILRAQPPPPGTAFDPAHPIAWKTGTSFAFRDARACGFTPEYTVCTWVGRQDGSPRPGATGRDVAAPLLFRVFGLLPAEGGGEAMAAPFPAVAAPSLRRTAAQPKLLVVFPPDKAELAYDPAFPIDLQAKGGSPPYSWTADGVPVGNQAGGQGMAWQASGPGFVHLTVLDHAGHVASVDVRLMQE